jgi:hypothetical protein
MNLFKTLAERFEKVMVAVTFAEAGEFETARNTMQEESSQKKPRPKQRRKPLRPLSAQ